MINFPSPADAFASAQLHTADADPAIMDDRVIAEMSDADLIQLDAIEVNLMEALANVRVLRAMRDLGRKGTKE